MELGFAKVVLTLTVVLGALSMVVNGGRLLKANDGMVQPQTFPGFPGFGQGTTLPSPGLGLGTTFPSPGLGLGTTFPSPLGSGTTFPSPGLGSGTTFPSPGGSLPTPSLGSSGGPFCFPGVQCAPAQPSFQSGPSGAGATLSGSP